MPPLIYLIGFESGRAAKLASAHQWNVLNTEPPFPIDRIPDAIVWATPGPSHDELQVLNAKWPIARQPALVVPSISMIDADLRRLIEREWIRSGLNQFEELGGSDFVKEMVDLFHSQVADQLQQLGQAGAANDCGEMMRLTHTLKSTFANFGARNLKALAFEMETAANEGDNSRFVENFNNLKADTKNFEDLLDQCAEDR